MDGKLVKVGNFGVRDYWRMFKARGIRRPVQYFLQTHLFDLVRGTDTHAWLPRAGYTDPPPNIDHGGYYMCSPTAVVKRAFKEVLDRFEPGFQDRVFVDLGCGKGKVLFAWREMLGSRRLAQRTLGIEYYGPLVEIARRNQKILGLGEKELFLEADATTLDYGRYGSSFILYMYNPFDDLILSAVLEQFTAFDTIAIHTNEDHLQCMVSAGFELLHKSEGWPPEMNLAIYHRKADGQSKPSNRGMCSGR